MGDMLLALGGGFTLSTLFVSPDGMALLMLFATVIGLSFPCLAHNLFNSLEQFYMVRQN